MTSMFHHWTTVNGVLDAMVIVEEPDTTPRDDNAYSRRTVEAILNGESPATPDMVQACQDAMAAYPAYKAQGLVHA